MTRRSRCRRPACTSSAAPAPPLTAAVLAPIEAVSAEMWPGVPVVPILQPGGTDATWFNAAGIPAFGVSGIFIDPDLGGIHGLNERIRVTSLMEGREFLYRLVKRYAEAPPSRVNPLKRFCRTPSAWRRH